MNLVKEAELNVIKVAKMWEQSLVFCNTLSSFGNKMCHEHIGGKEIKQFSYEKFKEVFGDDRTIIMQFLDQHGMIPHTWKSEDEDEFRKQAREKI
jgi:hypothetical protein